MELVVQIAAGIVLGGVCLFCLYGFYTVTTFRRYPLMPHK